MIALLLSLTLAHATQIEVEYVPCPLGGAQVEVSRLISQNSMAGWDSDGAVYSTQGQFRAFEVATCPNYALSLYGPDMEAGLSEEEIERLRPVVERLEGDYPRPDLLQVWDRYAMAATAYTALGRSDLDVARVWIKGGWTIRDAAVGEIVGLHGPLLTRQLLITGDGELARTDLDIEQRKILLFNMARAAHRGGYAAERDAYMARIVELGDLDKAEQRALSALSQAAELEPTYQRHAVAHLTRALESGTASRGEQAEIHYLMGDLLRRMGETELALAAFDSVADDRQAEDTFRKLASYLAAELRGETPWVGLDGNPFTSPIGD